MAAMASKSSLSFLFFFFLAFFSTLHARESQFFAKVSNNEPVNQQDPTVTPKAAGGGAYGLFGHESGQLPPSATNDNNLPANLPENYNPVAYTTPIHSSTQDVPEEFNEPHAYQYNGEGSMYNSQKQEQFVGNNDVNMYNSEKQEVGTNGGGMYNSQKQGMSDNGKYYYSGGDAYNSGKQVVDETRLMDSEDGGNTYNTQKQENGRYNNGGNMYNPEKQGMSDTRFLENGKYYYDLNTENLNANSRGFDSRNGYNTKGYYGNNDNSFERYNTNGGYENQEEYQDDHFNP